MKAIQPATQFLLFSIICLLGIMPVAASAQHYSYSGSDVFDNTTGLTWRRCPEGMTVSGTGAAATCSGTATTFTHELALQQATSQATSTKVAWRLPNVKELTSIADKTIANPSIDSTAFPATPTEYFWSSSPVVGNSTSAWGVYFRDGDVMPQSRTNPLYVRLVH